MLVRTAAQLRRGARRPTPSPTTGVDPKTLHVTFLAARPGRQQVARARGGRPGSSATTGSSGRPTDVYLHCPGGYGETKLNNTYLERRLGVTATTRNWRTVTTLADWPPRPGERVAESDQAARSR